VLQKSKGEVKNKFLRGLVGTIQNVYSTKYVDRRGACSRALTEKHASNARQKPYRVVSKPLAKGVWYHIADADTLEDIEQDWVWIEDNVVCGIGLGV